MNVGEKAKRNTTGLKNLRDLPPDVRREIQSKGGKKTAAKRREAKMVREALLELLTKPSRSTKGKGNSCKTSYDLKSLEDAMDQQNNTTVMVQILTPYIQKAREGDAYSLQLILAILGQLNNGKGSGDSTDTPADDGAVRIHLLRGEKPADPQDEGGGVDG